MISLGISIGVYASVLWLLGISGLLVKPFILLVSVIFFIYCIVILKPTKIQPISLHQSEKVIIVFIFLLVMINVIGVLGPEIGFDALWYHLTLPHLYLLFHKVTFMKGSLLQYSGMPQLGEMLYIPSLAIGNEITAKLVHFIFGLLCMIALYLLSQKYVSRTTSLLIVLIFASNLVFSWESITAYIDLIRTFFEILTLWSFLMWWEKRSYLWLMKTGILLSFVISTKLLGIGTFFIFVILLCYRLIIDKKRYVPIKSLLMFSFFSFFTPSLWFLRTLLYTGNPFYPFFTGNYPVNFSLSLFSPLIVLTRLWDMFLHLPDPISPIYIIILPLIIINYKNLKKVYNPIFMYCLSAIIIWYITPPTGGGRFILPYLPAFSLAVGITYQEVKMKELQKIVLIAIFFIAAVTICYRGAANAKFIPVLLGQEKKETFLTNHLAFSLGDFYDIDHYFSDHITSKDMVLLYGFHNLYYLDFPYLHSDWIERGERFNYIATQNTPLPARFVGWKLLYKNEITHVQLYSRGGQWETY